MRKIKTILYILPLLFISFLSVSDTKVYAKDGEDVELQKQIAEIQKENQLKNKEVKKYTTEEIRELLKENKAFFKYDENTNLYYVTILEKEKETKQEISRKEALDLGLVKETKYDKKQDVAEKEVTKKVEEQNNSNVRKEQENIRDNPLFKILIVFIFLFVVTLVFYFFKNQKIKKENE